MTFVYTPLELWDDTKERTETDRSLATAGRLQQLLLQQAREDGREDDILRLLAHAPLTDAGNAECFVAIYHQRGGKSRFWYGLASRDVAERDLNIPYSATPRWFRKFTYDESTVDDNPCMGAQWRPCAPPLIEMLLVVRERRKLAEGGVLLGGKRTAVNALLRCESHPRLVGALKLAAELMYSDSIATFKYVV